MPSKKKESTAAKTAAKKPVRSSDPFKTSSLRGAKKVPTNIRSLSPTKNYSPKRPSNKRQKATCAISDDSTNGGGPLWRMPRRGGSQQAQPAVTPKQPKKYNSTPARVQASSKPESFIRWKRHRTKVTQSESSKRNSKRGSVITDVSSADEDDSDSGSSIEILVPPKLSHAQTMAVARHRSTSEKRKSTSEKRKVLPDRTRSMNDRRPAKAPATVSPTSWSRPAHERAGAQAPKPVRNRSLNTGGEISSGGRTRGKSTSEKRKILPDRTRSMNDRRPAKAPATVSPISWSRPARERTGAQSPKPVRNRSLNTGGETSSGGRTRGRSPSPVPSRKQGVGSRKASFGRRPATTSPVFRVTETPPKEKKRTVFGKFMRTSRKDVEPSPEIAKKSPPPPVQPSAGGVVTPSFNNRNQAIKGDRRGSTGSPALVPQGEGRQTRQRAPFRDQLPGRRVASMATEDCNNPPAPPSRLNMNNRATGNMNKGSSIRERSQGSSRSPARNRPPGRRVASMATEESNNPPAPSISRLNLNNPAPPTTAKGSSVRETAEGSSIRERSGERSARHMPGRRVASCAVDDRPPSSINRRLRSNVTDEISTISGRRGSTGTNGSAERPMSIRSNGSTERPMSIRSNRSNTSNNSHGGSVRSGRSRTPPPRSTSGRGAGRGSMPLQRTHQTEYESVHHMPVSLQNKYGAQLGRFASSGGRGSGQSNVFSGRVTADGRKVPTAPIGNTKRIVVPIGGTPVSERHYQQPGRPMGPRTAGRSAVPGRSRHPYTAQPIPNFAETAQNQGRKKRRGAANGGGFGVHGRGPEHIPSKIFTGEPDPKSHVHVRMKKTEAKPFMIPIVPDDNNVVLPGIEKAIHDIIAPGGSVRVLICSVNLGNAQPDNESLTEWIPSDGCIKYAVSNPPRYPILLKSPGKGNDYGNVLQTNPSVRESSGPLELISEDSFGEFGEASFGNLTSDSTNLPLDKQPSYLQLPSGEIMIETVDEEAEEDKSVVLTDCVELKRVRRKSEGITASPEPEPLDLEPPDNAGKSPTEIEDTEVLGTLEDLAEPLVLEPPGVAKESPNKNEETKVPLPAFGTASKEKVEPDVEESEAPNGIGKVSLEDAESDGSCLDDDSFEVKPVKKADKAEDIVMPRRSTASTNKLTSIRQRIEDSIRKSQEDGFAFGEAFHEKQRSILRAEKLRNQEARVQLHLGGQADARTTGLENFHGKQKEQREKEKATKSMMFRRSVGRFVGKPTLGWVDAATATRQSLPNHLPTKDMFESVIDDECKVESKSQNDSTYPKDSSPAQIQGIDIVEDSHGIDKTETAGDVVSTADKNDSCKNEKDDSSTREESTCLGGDESGGSAIAEDTSPAADPKAAKENEPSLSSSEAEKPEKSTRQIDAGKRVPGEVLVQESGEPNDDSSRESRGNDASKEHATDDSSNGKVEKHESPSSSSPLDDSAPLREDRKNDQGASKLVNHATGDANASVSSSNFDITRDENRNNSGIAIGENWGLTHDAVESHGTINSAPFSEHSPAQHFEIIVIGMQEATFDMEENNESNAKDQLLFKSDQTINTNSSSDESDYDNDSIDDYDYDNSNDNYLDSEECDDLDSEQKQTFDPSCDEVDIDDDGGGSSVKKSTKTLNNSGKLEISPKTSQKLFHIAKKARKKTMKTLNAGMKTAKAVKTLMSEKNHTKREVPTMQQLSVPSEDGGMVKWTDTDMLHYMFDGQLPSYERALSYQLGEMRLLIYYLKTSVDVNVLSVKTKNTGKHNLANKGGIVTEVAVNGSTRLCFSSAHLEAHEGENKFEKRCHSFKRIFNAAQSSVTSFKYDASMASHYSFFMGDLNFRTKLPYIEAGSEEHIQASHNLTEMKDWELLNRYDELSKALHEKKCLAGWKTPYCNFDPTFKVARQEGYKYNILRSPSYTDRILYKAIHQLEDCLELFLYEPIANFTSSDHKPIRGAFEIQLNEKLDLSPSMSNALVAEESLHILFTQIECSLERSQYMTRSNSKSEDEIVKPNPFVSFISTPPEALELDLSARKKSAWKWLGLRNSTKSSRPEGLRQKKSKSKSTTKESDYNSLSKQWPGTKVISETFTPKWENDEIHFELRTCMEDDSFIDLSGALMHISVFDERENTPKLLGSFTLNLAALIKMTKEAVKNNNDSSLDIGSRHARALGMAQPKQNKWGRMLSRKPSARLSGLIESLSEDIDKDSKESEKLKQLKITTLNIKEALFASGIEIGTIECTVDAWWMRNEEDDTRPNEPKDFDH